MGQSRSDLVAIERHSITGFVVYDVSSDELEQLEREPAAISEDFSFAIVGLTAGISFLIAITTTTIKSDRVYETYFVVTVIGFIVAVYFGYRWYRGRGRYRTVIRKIRERVGPFGQQGKEATIPDPAGTPSSAQQSSEPGGGS